MLSILTAGPIADGLEKVSHLVCEDDHHEKARVQNSQCNCYNPPLNRNRSEEKYNLGKINLSEM